MASKIGDRMNQVRKFAHAATKHADASSSAVKSEPLRQTKLPNGILVASIENYSPVSRIGVYLRAGSRYETADNQGITHYLRNAVGLSTKTSTTFGITRNIDYFGGMLNATTTRDNLIYLIENARDKNAETVKYLIDSVSKPAFKSWELDDNLYRLKIDVERYQINAQAQLADCLHRAAFKGGLSNSLHIESFNIGRYSTNELMEFTKKHFLSNNVTVVGLGVDHDQLVDLVQKDLELGSGSSTESLKSKYIGGDCRKALNSKLTFATVASEGVSFKNRKEFVALELLAEILGKDARLKYGQGSGKLQQAAQKVAKEAFKLGAVNISYADTGLFGFTVICDGKEVHELVKSCVAVVRKTAKEFNDSDLNISKTKLKADLLNSLENHSTQLQFLGIEGSLTGQVSSYEDLEKLIDSVTAKDVVSVASKMIKSKPSIAAVGHLDNMPFAEDLV